MITILPKSDKDTVKLKVNGLPIPDSNECGRIQVSSLRNYDHNWPPLGPA